MRKKLFLQKSIKANFFNESVPEWNKFRVKVFQQEVLLCFTEFQATSFPRKGFGATELRNIKNGSPPKKPRLPSSRLLGARALVCFCARALFSPYLINAVFFFFFFSYFWSAPIVPTSRSRPQLLPPHNSRCETPFGSVSGSPAPVLPVRPAVRAKRQTGWLVDSGHTQTSFRVDGGGFENKYHVLKSKKGERKKDFQFMSLFLFSLRLMAL